MEGQANSVAVGRSEEETSDVVVGEKTGAGVVAVGVEEGVAKASSVGSVSVEGGEGADAAAAVAGKKKKKKKKGKKNGAAAVDGVSATGSSSSASPAAAVASHEKKSESAVHLLGDRSLKPAFQNLDLSKDLKEEKATHPFWHSQPVVNMKESAALKAESAAIEVKTLDDVPKEPMELPQGFEWVEVDVLNADEMKVVYELLRDHYVTDDDMMFRFDYPVPLLQWAMMPPGWKKSWHIGVRRIKNNQMVGFITGVPCTTSVYTKKVTMVEINFLCVHKQYRDKRLAPVLITEITRRVNLQNIWQAVFTAGVVLPHPISSCRYYHRSLNPKKLIEVKFSHKHPKLTYKGTLKHYALPDKTSTPGLRPLEKRDVEATCTLLNKFLSAYHLTMEFSLEEFEHWLLPREGVVYSWVVENPKTRLITDLISFYHLPSSILNHDKHKTLRAAYSFYNVSVGTPWLELMGDALILAKNLDFDVFNALDVMENQTFLEPLKFGRGDGNLQYYLYNWKCPPTKPEGVGLVLM